MPRSNAPWPLPVACLALALLPGPGCGERDGLDRQAVSGSVTLDGKPLAEGTIRFTPEATGGATTDVSTDVSGGKYSFSSNSGPVPGSYKVEINSIENTPFQPPQGKMPGEFVIPPKKQNVPSKYNLNSSLKASVKSGQDAPIDFALDSK